MNFKPVRLLKEASLSLIFATGIFVLVTWQHAWAEDTADPKVGERFYVGGELGLMYGLGVRGTWLHSDESGKPLLHVDAGAKSILLINSVFAEAGYHPFGNSLFVGARVQDTIVTDPLSGNGLLSSHRATAGALVGAQGPVFNQSGKGKVLLGVQGGIDYVEGSAFPYGTDTRLPLVPHLEFTLSGKVADTGK